jgi:hypothetical protein
MRREYDVQPLFINNRWFRKVVIDDHVDKHFDHINDELIIMLVKELNGRDELPVKKSDGFLYFATALKLEHDWYKLVWLTEKNSLYVGVVTAYKDRRIK